jgi:hypothetical protein
MVLTNSELIASLQNEVRILLHLSGKIEPQMRDYRPTPKQRSTHELLKYLDVMGPALVIAGKSGTFDTAVWTELNTAAQARTFEQTLASIAKQSDAYASMLADVSDADMRGEIEMFGQKTTRGKFFVNSVLCGFAAYRTQLFCYLKACGRDELNTMNLWAGVDAPMAAV